VAQSERIHVERSSRVDGQAVLAGGAHRLVHALVAEAVDDRSDALVIVVPHGNHELDIVFFGDDQRTGGLGFRRACSSRRFRLRLSGRRAAKRAMDLIQQESFERGPVFELGVEIGVGAVAYVGAGT